MYVECIKRRKITRIIFDKAGAISASVDNKLCHHGLLIQWFHMLRLAQSCSAHKPTESHQTLPSLCMILKVIHAGVGWPRSGLQDYFKSPLISYLWFEGIEL